MSKIIKDFYEKAGTLPTLLQQKIVQFEKHPDIKQEFEYWIEHRKFKNAGVEVKGYTAEKLAALSEYLDGEGAYLLLVELRENPDRAMRRIKSGFKRK